jgi:hypothetical protein
MPHWREAKNVCDFSIPDKVFDEIGGDGTVRAIASIQQYIDSSKTWHKGPFGLAVCEDEVRLGKSKAFGGASRALGVPIQDFAAYQVRLISGTQLYELYSELNSGGSIAFLFRSKDAAETVAEFINSGILFSQMDR